jgi:hypothetical protein
MDKFTFIRNNPTNPNRKAVEYATTNVLLGCFAFCSEDVISRLKAFFADRKQESVTFEFDNGEQVEVRRE